MHVPHTAQWTVFFGLKNLQVEQNFNLPEISGKKIVILSKFLIARLGGTGQDLAEPGRRPSVEDRKRFSLNFDSSGFWTSFRKGDGSEERE